MKKHTSLLTSLLAFILMTALPTALADTLILPDDLTTIEAEAFYGTDADTIILPEGVTFIGDDAFGGSNTLRTVYVPDALMNREEAALTGSERARFVSLSKDWSTEYDYTVGDDSVTITKYKGNDADISIPPLIEGKPVTVIGGQAFKNNTNLTSVDIPEGVTSIGDAAFSGCTRLTAVLYPDSLRTLGMAAFADCGSSISSEFIYDLPDHIVSIHQTGSRDDTFYNCNALKRVTPDSQTAYLLSSPDFVMKDENSYSKQWFSFAGHEDFRYLYLTDTVDGMETRRLHLMKYTKSDTEVSIQQQEGGYTQLSVLHKDAFKNKADMTQVSIPEGVAVIGESAFEGCTNLTNVSFPDSLREIHRAAFINCGGNISEDFYFDLPDNLTFIEQTGSSNDAFYNCNAIRRVTPGSATAYLLSENLHTSEGWWADRWFTFAGQEDFRYLYFEGEDGGDEAGRGLRLVKYVGSSGAITLPAQADGVPPLTSIHTNVFKNRTKLESIVLPDTITLIKASAFQGCTGLSVIHIPTALRTMETNVFTDCAKDAYDDVAHDFPTYSFPMRREALDYVHDNSNLATFYGCMAHIEFAGDGETWQ